MLRETGLYDEIRQTVIVSSPSVEKENRRDPAGFLDDSPRLL